MCIRDSGTVAFARGDIIDSASRQFFINTGDNPSLDHSASSCTREDEVRQTKAEARGLYRPSTCRTFGYALFGMVIRGMEVVHRIEALPTGTTEEFDDLPESPILIERAIQLPAID